MLIWTRFIQEYFCELFDPSECAEDVKSSLFSLILMELIDICRHTAAALALKPQGDLVLPVLKYIEEHYQTLTLQELSALFCLNPDYLSRLLKTRTGQSFQALVTSQRMSVAKHHQNVTFFYKKFAALCGCSPGEYRKAGQS